MKKNIPIWILSIAASLFLSTGLLAQEQIEMSIKVTKDGKVVKDTSYQFDNAAEAKNAMKMMEVMSGDELHKEHVTYNYTTAHSGHGEAKTMVFISKDGETTEISELHGDSLVWVTEEEHDGKKVIVMKSGDVVKKKEIKVMVSSDGEGNWTVVEGDEKMMDKDENVKVNVIKIMEEEGDGENVKVIVITESGDLHEDHDHDEEVEVKVIVITESGDLHEDHDHDVDHDHDSDHDEEVEVKVVKKKEKK
jgi:hypothetical protein